MAVPALHLVAAPGEPVCLRPLTLAPENWSGVTDALIPVRKVDTSGPGERARAVGREARFIKGPLPLGWVALATKTGHPLALPVLLAFKHKTDLLRQPWVKPPAAVLRLFGVDKDGRSRAIAALERGPGWSRCGGARGGRRWCGWCHGGPARRRARAVGSVSVPPRVLVHRTPFGTRIEWHRGSGLLALDVAGRCRTLRPDERRRQLPDAWAS
jgi:hypothetical protein